MIFHVGHHNESRIVQSICAEKLNNIWVAEGGPDLAARHLQFTCPNFVSKRLSHLRAPRRQSTLDAETHALEASASPPRRARANLRRTTWALSGESKSERARRMGRVAVWLLWTQKVGIRGNGRKRGYRVGLGSPNFMAQGSVNTTFDGIAPQLGSRASTCDTQRRAAMPHIARAAEAVRRVRRRLHVRRKRGIGAKTKRKGSQERPQTTTSRPPQPSFAAHAAPSSMLSSAVACGAREQEASKIRGEGGHARCWRAGVKRVWQRALGS
ncbi:hypothetical protein C8J57DRAFT_1472929 [Mycena rebaudengoi]|nr:hypothetical protein C8J57DRAFT_1472929 [Mycena rebaudengoi]